MVEATDAQYVPSAPGEMKGETYRELLRISANLARIAEDLVDIKARLEALEP